MALSFLIVVSAIALLGVVFCIAFHACMRCRFYTVNSIGLTVSCIDKVIRIRYYHRSSNSNISSISSHGDSNSDSNISNDKKDINIIVDSSTYKT